MFLPLSNRYQKFYILKVLTAKVFVRGGQVTTSERKNWFMSKFNGDRPLHTKGQKRECPSGKKRFRDPRQAVDALHRAANQRNGAAVNGLNCRRHEIRKYKCQLCSGIHLTSKAKWSSSPKGL